jgi:hypothetical protein
MGLVIQELEKIETQHGYNETTIKRHGGALGERLDDGLSAWKLGVRRRSVQDVMLLSIVFYDWRDDAGLEKTRGPAESPVTDGGREPVKGQRSHLTDNGRNQR